MEAVVIVWIILMLGSTAIRCMTNNEEWEGIQMLVLIGGVVVIGVLGLIVS
jgi:hypothetical protein